MDSAAAAEELSALFERLEVPCRVLDTADKGKHVVATAPIAKGQVLFEERPLAVWRFHADDGSCRPAALCDGCLAVLTPDAVPCAGECGEAFFCAPECRDASATAHGLLCPALAELRAFHRRVTAAGEAPSPISVESMARCVAALAVRYARIAAQNDGAEAAVLFPHAAHNFNRLLEPPRDVPFEGIDAGLWCRTVRSALSGPVAALVGREVAAALLKDDTLHTFLGQLTINAQAINFAPGTSAEGCSGSRGAGLFVLQSNFNHSCAPNVRIDFGADSEISLRARDDIAAGAELCITYIPELVLAVEKAAQRRERLRPYFFTCACPKCVAEDSTAQSP